MHANGKAKADRPPADLEESLWAAIDHARLYDERAIAAKLLLIVQDLPSRWTPRPPKHGSRHEPASSP